MDKIEEEMVNLYVDKEMSIRRIALRFKTNEERVKKILVRNEISIRSKQEQQRTSTNRRRQRSIMRKVSKRSELREKHADATRALWQNEDYREKVLTGRAKADPAWKQRVSKKLKARLIEPVNAEKLRQISLDNWRDNREEMLQRRKDIQGPDFNKKVSEGLKEKWQDNLYRHKVSEGLHNYWAASPERKVARAEQSRWLWQDASYRVKVLAGLTQRWALPGARKEWGLFVKQAIKPYWDSYWLEKSKLLGLTNKLSALSRRENTRLFGQIKSGNQKARYEFLCHNMGLAQKIASNIWGNIAAFFPNWQEANVDLKVVTQEAYLGLIDALKKYDPIKGSFSTFLFVHIPRFVKRQLQKTALIPEPLNIGNYQYKLSDPALFLHEAVYIDSLQYDENTEEYKGDGFSVFIPAPEDNCFTISEIEYSEMEYSKIVQVITEKIKLSEREKQILLMRMSGHTLKQIGGQFNFSRARAQQILESIQKKIKEIFTKEDFGL